MINDVLKLILGPNKTIGRTGFNERMGIDLKSYDDYNDTDIFDYEYAVCVGAGIGVTPFASLLRSIFYKKRLNTKILLKKVHFVWICPEMKAFEWFTDLLRQVEIRS